MYTIRSLEWNSFFFELRLEFLVLQFDRGIWNSVWNKQWGYLGFSYKCLMNKIYLLQVKPATRIDGDIDIFLLISRGDFV